VKYHPRDVQPDYMGAGQYPGVMIVPQTVPAELILARLGSRVESIYSEFSSILVTAAWVNPEIERYCLSGTSVQSALYAREIHEMLVRSGVTMLTPS
ncbi:MAG: hypothetical protein K8I30_21295, partial [Anaerolineae bacterium]|nr:hypothetical protein [Anaerolineae bacterium]